MTAPAVASAAAASYGQAVKRWQRSVCKRFVVVVVLLGATGCPGTRGPAPRAPVSVSPSPPPPPGGSTATGKPEAGTPLIDLAGVACAASPCAYFPGTAGYFRCLAGGAGSCFHFGASCQPADACMLDPADRAYKHCAAAVEGKCQRFGAACAPAGTCWYRPDDRLYHTCEQPNAGACAKWGALCAPGA
jgi:hypothetical protein